MLTAEMDAPVAANGHAAEIDILFSFLPSSHQTEELPEPRRNVPFKSVQTTG